MFSEHQTAPRSGHLHGWKPDGEAEIAATQVRDLVQHPGWEILLASLSQFQRHEHLLLMRGDPAANQMVYERHLGVMAGLDMLPALAAGVIDNGRAQERMRDVG